MTRLVERSRFPLAPHIAAALALCAVASLPCACRKGDSSATNTPPTDAASPEASSTPTSATQQAGRVSPDSRSSSALTRAPAPSSTWMPPSASFEPLATRTYAMVVEHRASGPVSASGPASASAPPPQPPAATASSEPLIVYAGTTAGVVAYDYSDGDQPRTLATLVLRDEVQSLVRVAGSSWLAASTGPSGVAIVDTTKAVAGTLSRVNQHPWSDSQRGDCFTAMNVVTTKTPRGAINAFVACGSSGVASLEMTEPFALSRTVKLSGYVRDLALLDRHSGVSNASMSDARVIAAAGHGGVAVVDFETSTPRVMASLDVGGEARSVAVAGGFAYVAVATVGVVVVDVTSPQRLSVVSKFTPSFTDMARSITVRDKLALLCAGDSGLFTIDIANPRAIKQLGLFDPPQAINHATIEGDLAYVSNDARGIAIVDISRPQQPHKVFPSDEKRPRQ